MDTSPRSAGEIRIRGQRINARREMRPYRRELQDSNPLSPGSSHLQPGPI